MKKTLLLLFLLIFTAVFSQDYILGKVVSEQNTDLPNVLVYNIRTNEKTFTDNEGNYMIAAKNNDELRFIKQKFDRISYKITLEDFKKNLKIKLIKSAVEIEEVEIKKKLTGNLKEDISNVENKRKSKINKEVREMILENTDISILMPKSGEFKQPKGEGFSIGKVKDKWSSVDVAEGYFYLLGTDYFESLNLKKDEIYPFIFYIMQDLDLKGCKKRGFFKNEDIKNFKSLAEKKIIFFKKLK